MREFFAEVRMTRERMLRMTSGGAPLQPPSGESLTHWRIKIINEWQIGCHIVDSGSSLTGIICRSLSADAPSNHFHRWLSVSFESPTVQLRVPSADLTRVAKLSRGSLFIWVRRAVCAAFRTSCTGSFNNGRMRSFRLLNIQTA